DAMANGKTRRSYNEPYTRHKHTAYRTERPQTQPGDFEVSLLILSSIVIKADGKQDQRELEFVRNQFVSMYGKERANNAFRLFIVINKQNSTNRPVCLDIPHIIDQAYRLQLLQI